MWIGSITLEHVNYIMWVLEQTGNICLLFIVYVELGNLGGVILLALCAGTTSSSQEYWLETMFIALLFQVSTINNIHIIDSANTIHNILIL